MNITIKDNMLKDNRLKPQEVYLFLQMVRMCDERSILNISGKDLMDETRIKNKTVLLGYLKNLIECGYVSRLENVNKKATYQINKQEYFKR